VDGLGWVLPAHCGKKAFFRIWLCSSRAACTTVAKRYLLYWRCRAAGGGHGRCLACIPFIAHLACILILFVDFCGRSGAAARSSATTRRIHTYENGGCAVQRFYAACAAPLLYVHPASPVRTRAHCCAPSPPTTHGAAACAFTAAALQITALFTGCQNCAVARAGSAGKPGAAATHISVAARSSVNAAWRQAGGIYNCRCCDNARSQAVEQPLPDWEGKTWRGDAVLARLCTRRCASAPQPARYAMLPPP